MNYKQATEKLNYLRTRLKEMGIDHPDFKSYRKKVIKLDKKLKEMDASLRIYTTPRGNYESKL